MYLRVKKVIVNVNTNFTNPKTATLTISSKYKKDNRIESDIKNIPPTLLLLNHVTILLFSINEVT
tara:strand:+ start:358 stop:552 length:195 start_codon:yes stop_codon:yes gene_type:complete